MLDIFLWILILIIMLLVVAWFMFFLVFQMILGYGVPYVPTPEYKVKKLREVIKLKKGQKFLDIGCGDGQIVAAIAEKYPENICLGIENSFYPYFLAQRKRKKMKGKYDLARGDFFRRDISDYDVIYCYLFPMLMPSVYRKIQRECKPGTLLYSSAFDVPGVECYDKIHIQDEKYFYVYRV